MSVSLRVCSDHQIIEPEGLDRMALSIKDIDTIIERWDEEQWENHWRAFDRQWMEQARQDIADLVTHIREMGDRAGDLSDDLGSTADKLEGGG